MTGAEHEPTRVCWFHCFSGIAGDMALGSLLDAGADLDEVLQILHRLPVSGWSLEPEAVLRAGIAATRAVVKVDPDGRARTLPVIVSILEDAGLPERVLRRSLEAFVALAETEGSLHKIASDEVHFHELGAHDTIVDVVGCAAALEVLSIDEVVSSPVALGSGLVAMEHGVLPNPPPAVLRLLEGVPVVGRDIDLELTTPTGAAIVSCWASSFGPIPKMRVESVGFGAGGREINGTPNCTEAVIGTRQQDGAGHLEEAGQPLVLLEVNLDDVPGEQVAEAASVMLEHGAADAWITPVLMKKGRPGQVLSVLCDAGLAAELRGLVLLHTGSFGVRSSQVERFALSRRGERVELDGEVLGVKVGPGRAKVEHDDAARVARKTGSSVAEVVARATDAWRARHDAPGT